MLEWKPEIRRRLANLKLEPTREAAIIEELAQYLDDCYEESLASGATDDEAYRAALAELSGSELLARELRRVEKCRAVSFRSSARGLHTGACLAKAMMW